MYNKLFFIYTNLWQSWFWSQSAASSLVLVRCVEKVPYRVARGEAVDPHGELVVAILGVHNVVPAKDALLVARGRCDRMNPNVTICMKNGRFTRGNAQVNTHVGRRRGCPGCPEGRWGPGTGMLVGTRSDPQAGGCRSGWEP